MKGAAARQRDMERQTYKEPEAEDKVMTSPEAEADGGDR